MAAAELELHDAVLTEIHVNWPAASAIVTVRGASGSALLTLAGVKDVHVPHRHPWGPSRSINSARWRAATTNTPGLLQIEMQSGDVIRVEADDCTF